jgi:phage-related minor tail protein
MALLDTRLKEVIGLRRQENPDVADAIAAGGYKVARARYLFASEGGAQGDISLGVTIPSGAIITHGFMKVVTPPTGVGASIAVKVEGAGDIIAAAALSGAPWSTTGRKSIIPAGTGATSVETTAARAVTVTVSAADLTAGDFSVYLFYIDTD